MHVSRISDRDTEFCLLSCTKKELLQCGHFLAFYLNVTIHFIVENCVLICSFLNIACKVLYPTKIINNEAFLIVVKY